MTTHPLYACKAFARTATHLAVAVGAVVASTLVAPMATAAPNMDSGLLWNLFNQQHRNAGCPNYNQTAQVNNAVGQVAHSIAYPLPQGTIAGTGEVGGDTALRNNGYIPTVWGEAVYVNMGDHATPQDAMKFWENANTKGIFPNCDNHDLGTGISVNGNKWVAVALVGTGGGHDSPPPLVK